MEASYALRLKGREWYVSDSGLEAAPCQEVEGIEGRATALREVSGPAEAVGMGTVEATAAALAVVTVGQGRRRRAWMVEEAMTHH